MSTGPMMTVGEVQQLGRWLTPRPVYALITAGRLQARRVGRHWLINRDSAFSAILGSTTKEHGQTLWCLMNEQTGLAYSSGSSEPVTVDRATWFRLEEAASAVLAAVGGPYVVVKARLEAQS